jgi:uncharacterized protein (TIGR03083 family)
MEITQTSISQGMREERERLVAYLESVPEGAWDKASLCEGWRVRDVVAHLVGNAKDIAAQNVANAGSVEYNQRQLDERADRTPTELLSEWAEQGPLLEQTMASLPDEFWNTPYPPFGTVGEALQRLLEDIWVHAQDIRVPLGDEPVPGPGVGATLDVLEREIPERFPRLAPEVGAVEIEAGDEKRLVAIGDGATVKVKGDPVTICLVATGRVPLDRAIGDGTLEVSPTSPPSFADAFNFYGP